MRITIYLLAIILVSLLGLVKFIQCAANCSAFTTKSACTQNSSCNWAADTTKDQCTNIHEECNTLSNNSQLCLTTPGCLLEAGKQGFCNQKPSLGCTGLEKGVCSNNKNCIWTSIQDCENKQGGFKCAGLTEEKCNEDFDFCLSDYICKDIDGQKCKDLSKQDCEDAKEYCDYTKSTQEKCINKQGYCESLLTDDCLSNTDFCQFNQTKAFICEDRTSADICKLKTIEDCSINSEFCDIIQPPCIQNVDCTKIVDEAYCQESGCTFDTQSQKCSTSVDCTILSSSECINNSLLCLLPISVCQNKPTFNCASKTSRLECKLNKLFCNYTPAEGTCAPKDMCSKLTGYECQFFQKECNYTPEEGSCTIKNGLGCSEKNRIDCLDYPYCIAQFSECKDLEGDVCSIMNINECGMQNSRCQTSQQGYCSDSIITCPTDKASCGTNENCEWVGEIPDSCIQSLDCQLNTSTECQEKLDLCNYIPGGTCVTLNDLAQVNGQRLLFSLVLLSIIYISFI